MELKLQLNDNILEALIASGKDLIAILDNHGIYKYVGSSVRKVLGVDPDFFIGKSFTQFVHPEDLGYLMKDFETILSGTSELQTKPFRFSKPSGDWIWVETYVNNHLSNPSISGVIVNSRNITDEINDKLEKTIYLRELANAKERYNLVLKATHDIIWEIDLNKWGKGSFQDFRTFYENADELKGNKSNGGDGWIHPDEKNQVLASLYKAIQNPNVYFWTENYRYIRGDNIIIFVCDRGYIVRDNQQKALRVVGAMRDETNLRERELKIIRQNKLLREIADINSHEIRRPVANILGLVDILNKIQIADTSQKEIIDYINLATHELDAIIKKIIDTTYAID